MTSKTLTNLLVAYSLLSREQEMMSIYPDFFNRLLGALARPGVLNKVTDKELSLIVVALGRLQFSCASVDTILDHARRARWDSTLARQWVVTVLTLRCRPDELTNLRPQLIEVAQRLQDKLSHVKSKDKKYGSNKNQVLVIDYL